jgi:predicted dinucleotide-binding enzyme
MASSRSFSVGAIGAGEVAQAIAGHAVKAGHRVKFSNSRGPDSLAELVEKFHQYASAGTIAEAAEADIVILAVGFDKVPEAVKAVADWDGRIVIDATNQWLTGPDDEADLGDQTGSERNAALMPGARVVKAFNAIFASVAVQDPRRADGRVIVFLSGDDTDAKDTVSTFIASLGFAPIDIGGVQDGRLMAGRGPLVGLHAVKLELG